MKKLIFFILLTLSTNITAQTIIAGGGTQWNDTGKWQFKATANYPWKGLDYGSHSSPVFFSSGVDYTGGYDTRAFFVKPLSVKLDTSVFGSEKGDYGRPGFYLGVDAGYNYNFTDEETNKYSVYGKKGIIVSPNVTVDMAFLTLKGGYEYNISQKYGGCYIGIIVGLNSSFWTIVD